MKKLLKGLVFGVLFATFIAGTAYAGSLCICVGKGRLNCEIYNENGDYLGTLYYHDSPYC